jgi:hypothetical protein
MTREKKRQKDEKSSYVKKVDRERKVGSIKGKKLPKWPCIDSEEKEVVDHFVRL